MEVNRPLLLYFIDILKFLDTLGLLIREGNKIRKKLILTWILDTF